MTRRQSILFWVISILIFSIFLCAAYNWKKTQDENWEERRDDKCFLNMRKIGDAIKDIYWQRQNKKVKSISIGKKSKNNEYWWMDAVRKNGTTKLGPEAEDLLYCPFDTDRSHPSSYMSNPNLNVTDISKLKDADKTILLMEREPFHQGKYSCIFADFSGDLIDEKDINKFKRW
jgi:hypothetical protein